MCEPTTLMSQEDMRDLDLEEFMNLPNFTPYDLNVYFPCAVAYELNDAIDAVDYMDESGQIRCRELFIHNRIFHQNLYDSTTGEKHGLQRQWYPPLNDEPRLCPITETHYQQGFIEGEQKAYDYHGVATFKGSFHKSKQEGVSFRFENGSRYDENHSNGQLHGRQTETKPNGDTKSIFFRHGKKIGLINGLLDENAMDIVHWFDEQVFERLRKIPMIFLSGKNRTLDA